MKRQFLAAIVFSLLIAIYAFADNSIKTEVDKTYSSDAFLIEVKLGKAPPKAPPKKKPAIPGQGIPESEEPQTTL